MDKCSLLIIATAVSLDAFGVAFSLGLNKCLKSKDKLIFCLSFGFFQFLLAYVGATTGFMVNNYVIKIPKIVVGIIICIVGIIMIKESENGESCRVINPKVIIILGISVSIDAMVIGFTALSRVQSHFIIFYDTIFIGLVTFLFCFIAFVISFFIRKITVVSKYSGYIGGIILVLFGLNMIFF